MGTKQTKRENQKAAKVRKAKNQKKKTALKGTKSVMLLMIPVILVIGLAIWIIVDGVSAGKKDAEENTAGAAENGQASVDYSEFLTDEGLIKDIKASDYVKLADLDSLSVKSSEVEPDEKEISKALESYRETELVTDEGTLIKDGDSVNIDYVGYVDGEAFEGGDTKGQGTELTIGSKKYIDDFEEQLVGHAPGEKVEVNVTFPENYGKEELNGKDAVFNVTINGIYNHKQPSDEYVAKNFSDIASTYDELKEYVTDSLRRNNIEELAWNYMLDNSEIDSYPEDYLANLFETSNYMYESEYNYYNNYYYSLNGKYQWDSIYDYYGKDKEELDKAISDDAYSQCRYYLVAQTIFEKYDLRITENDVKSCITKRGYSEEDLEKLISSYGSGYIYQSTLGDAAKAYVSNHAKVEK